MLEIQTLRSKNFGLEIAKAKENRDGKGLPI